MLVVPMLYEDAVHGVIVISRIGRDKFDVDDETTFTIFAGYAALALVNASNLGRLEHQQAELQHQLTSQRRLLEVNERLLSTLEPSSVLDLIADSLKAIVPYDSLTVYRVDREAGVRRAVIARDMYADLILANEIPMGVGLTGWAIEQAEAVLVQPGPPRFALGPGARHAGGARIDDRRPADGPWRDDRDAQHRPRRERRGLLLVQRIRADEALRRSGLDRAPERGERTARSAFVPSRMRSRGCATTVRSSASSARPSRAAAADDRSRS